MVPTPVPTPRPLRNPTNTDQIAPATAATPHAASITASPDTTRATMTGKAPFSRSPTTTTAARFRPRARSAFVPPVRPDPTVLGSVPPVRRATRTPTGIDPQRYAPAMSAR